MPVTELALLRLSSGLTPDNASLRNNLSHAKGVMQNYTNATFYYFQQTEDPSYIYIVGEWASLDQHMNHFIPSSDNQAVLESLKDQLIIEWLIHADVSHANLPLPKSSAEIEKAKRGEVVWSFARHFVKDGRKDEFEKTFEANKHQLQDFITEGNMGGGWRVDKEHGKEEWVLICPYTSVQQHYDFAKTEGFKKYGLIREWIEGAEIKHAKLLDI